MIQQTTNFSREEPIPGYRTTTLLGRGGFGEVWKAVAPGGVAKAIKLVFGDDPTRAESELRSLNRIKDVRHPLILSIDRIEVVKGTLVIVTELGDCNLKEHCAKFRGQGHVGIPQKELMQLMHDAADALDYIYAEHSLQHLDVKPENFLVFGKHLKIADFGVVKHIYERSASMVHGLTPVYAGPELFEGKANRHSDQYSLAIVYQEMLTGQLPFDGLSPARLATQHMKEPPNLGSLPVRQQPVIARALSKDPHQRFSSCAELIEELQRAIEKPAQVAVPPMEAAPATNKTMPLPVPQGQPVIKAADTDTPRSAPPEKAKIGTNDSVDALLNHIHQDVAALPPTIVVGIGGTAAHVMQQLRVRINERLGHLENAPALKLLLIDSDVKQLNQINRDEDVWTEIETVATPLRRADEYRGQDGLKRWINRRWLYNIPRDQSTDGIRALGRLALVSNYKRLFPTLEKAIKEAKTKDSAARTSETLQLPFAPGKPRILLLASLSGGTGSGMLFDVAYFLRQKLTQEGFDNDSVDALLLHSTSRNKGRDKAIANAYVTLLELDHFSRRGHYFPGDPHLGINAYHGNNRTFGEIDFVHLGDNLDEQEWKDSSDDVAEYLFCSLLEKPRISPAAAPSEMLQGRTIGIQQLGASNRGFLKQFTSQMCLEMLDCWRGRELQDRNTVSFTQPTTFLNHVMVTNAAKQRRISEALDEKIATLGLNVERLLKHTQEVLVQEVGQTPKKYAESLIQNSLSLEDRPDNPLSQSALTVIDHVLSIEDGPALEEQEQNTLHNMLMARSETIANKLASELRTWLQEFVNDPSSRVDGAQFAAERAFSRVQDLISAVARDKAHLREKTDSLRLEITADYEELAKRRSSWNPFRSQRSGKLAALLSEYASAKIQGILLTVVHKQLRTIEAQVGTTIDQAQRLSHDLTRLSKKFELSKESESQSLASQSFDESVAWYVQSVRELLLSRRTQIIHDLEGVIEDILKKAGYSLQRFLDHRIELSDILLLPMREQARDVVARAVAKIHCDLIDGLPEQEELFPNGCPLPQLVQGVMASQWSHFPEDRTQYTVVVPQSANGHTLREFFHEQGGSIAVVNLITTGITILRRNEGVTPLQFLHTLTQGGEIYEELASRLHSREDIDWTAFVMAQPVASARQASPALTGGLPVDRTAVLE